MHMALKMIKDYLSNRRQRVKMNSNFSEWSDLLECVPQGSILGPLIFNIYLNDIVMINEYSEVCNLADDTTFHHTNTDLDDLIKQLEHDSHLALEWFESNYMKLNTINEHEHVWEKNWQ